MLPTPPPPPAAEPGRRGRRRAFTLIELIVVVIIIAVLAAIAGVAYNAYVGNARDTALRASATQVNRAITARSTRDDLTPSALVAQSLSPGNDLASFFAITADNLTYTPDSATAPTTLTVSSGGRAVCLVLGTEPGMAATMASGACVAPVAAPQPTPTAADPSATGPATPQQTASTTPAASPTSATTSAAPPAPAVNYVAVSAQGTVSTSADALTWTTPTTVVSSAQGVAYAGDRWFVLGTGSVASSVDGTTWATSTLPAGNTGALYDVAGNSTTGWLAAGANGHIVYSADGATWQTVTGYPGTPTNYTLTDVETFAGRFYVAASNGGTTGYSVTDPAAATPTWTKLTLSTDTAVNSPFAYAVLGGKLWTIPYSSYTGSQGYVYSSATGATGAASWTKGARLPQAGMAVLTMVGNDSGDMWEAQNSTSNAAYLYHSTNSGTTWTQVTSPTLTDLANAENIAYRGSTLVAVAANSTSTTKNLMRVTTDNGATWTKTTAMTGITGWRDVAAH